MYGSFKASNGLDKSWPVISERERFWRRSEQERLVAESQSCHAGAASSSLLWISASGTAPALESVCCGSDDMKTGCKDVVNFFKCALNIRLLFRIAQRRREVMLTRIF